MRKFTLFLMSLILSVGAATAQNSLDLTFTKVSADEATVNVLGVGVDATGITAEITANSAWKSLTADSETFPNASILCPDKNTKDMTAGNEGVITITLNNLPEGYSFKNVTFTSAAVNGGGAFQADNANAQHVNFTLAKGETNLGTVENVAIKVNSAAGESVTVPFEVAEAYTATEGTLVLTLTLSVTESKGCFYGLTKVSIETEAPAVEPEPEPEPEPEVNLVNATLSFADEAQRTYLSESQQVWEQNGVIVTNNKSASTNNVANYSNPARFYKNSELIVAVAEGKITEIVFDCNNSNYATALAQSITSGAEVSESSDIVTVTPNEASASFTIAALGGGQVRLDAVTVTYETSAAPVPFVKAPVASVESGVYTTAQSVTFASEYANAENPVINYYYTTNGDEPTEESALLEGALEVAESSIVKVIAVMTVDEDKYVSEVAAYDYIISEAISYVAVTTVDQIVAGNFIIVADGKAAVAKNANYGYLPVRNVTVVDGAVEDAVYYAFTLEAAEGGWYIKDNNGKYLYMTGTYNSFNMSDEVPAEGGVWTIAIAEGVATITNVAMNKYVQYTSYGTYGAYTEAQEGSIVPAIFIPYVEPDTDNTPSEETKALIEDAKELLTYKGIGTPTGDARTALENAIAQAEANPTAAAGIALSTALDAYYGATEIVLPEAGKIYTFTAVWSDKEYYIYNNNGTLSVAARGEEALPESAQFICEYNSEATYKFQFKTADGAYYLANPTIGGKNWLDNESITGLEAVSSQVTKFNVTKILAGGEVATTNDALFGLIQMDGWRGYDNGKATDAYGPIVVKHSALTFDGASAPFYNENFTSAFRIEEVEAPIAEKLEVVSVTPSEPVEVLDEITVEFSDEIEGTFDIMSMTQIYLGSRSNGCSFSVEGKVLTVTPFYPITAAGEYALVIPEGLITRKSDGSAVVITKENAVVFTVAEAVAPETFALEAFIFPAVEGELKEIKGIRVDANQGASLSEIPTEWTFTDDNDNSYEMNIQWLYDYETILIMFNPAITEAGTYTLNIPEGSLTTDDGKICEAATFSWTIEADEPEIPAIDLEKTYRIKSVSQNKYLNVEAYNMSNTSGPKGSVGLADLADTGDQIFHIEDAGNGNYYFKSCNGHYIVCRQWNVDACDNGEKSVLGIEFQENNQFYILNGANYFKVGEVDGEFGVYYPYCDAPQSVAELWVLEVAEFTDGISNVVIDENAVIYDLTGRKVKNAVKGIYIVNGKKVLVK